MRREVVGTGQSEYVCDSCGKDAYSQLVLHFWYGSKYDMNQGSVHFCDKCAENALNILTKEFKLKNFLKPIIEI